MHIALRPLSFYAGATPLIEDVTERELKRTLISSMFLSLLEIAEVNTAAMALEVVGQLSDENHVRAQLTQQDEALARCKEAWDTDDLMGVEDAWVSIHAITERIWQ